jgi:hypothetical protein
MTQLDDLEQQSPDASNLLKVLSFFDPESIPPLTETDLDDE